MFASIEAARAYVGNSQFPGMDLLLQRMVYQTGSAAPSSVVPAFIGQRYFRSGSNTWYTAYGVAAGEWGLETNA